MDCIEIQDRLTDIVDGRPLDGARRREVDTHVSTCPQCRAELDLARATKRALSRLARPHEVPAATVAGVRALIAEEERRVPAPLPPMGSTSVWRFVRRRPVWATAAFGAALAAVLFLLPPADGERRFNESSVAFVRQAISSYDAMLHDSETIQMRTSSEQELRAFFTTNGVACEVLIPHLQNASLIGGSVTTTAHARVAHVVYRCGKHYVCLCQLKFCDACQTNGTALSDSARACLEAGRWYWYKNAEQRNVGLWKYEDTVCAATSDCNPEEIAALFTEKPETMEH